MIDDDTRRAILAELLQATIADPIRPWQFTAEDYAAASGLTRSPARDRLARLVENGTLQTSFACRDGRRMRVYWRPGDVPPTE